MGRMSEGLNQVNSFIRTILAMVVVGGVAAAGFFGWTKYTQNDRAFDKISADLQQANSLLEQANVDLQTKQAEIEKLNVEVEKLETARRLLKMDSRVARLRVLDKKTDEATGALTTTVEFVELDDQGHEIGEPKVLPVEGDQIYIDFWVVKFDDEYVEKADLERGTSIALFRRIFSEKRKPEEGFVLDEPNSLPAKYAQGGEPSEFEQKIWKDFWKIANDRKAAEALGIRAAHGEAVSLKVEEGRSYLINLRASDGLTFEPEPSPIDAAVGES
jgi:hypothetical protein